MCPSPLRDFLPRPRPGRGPLCLTGASGAGTPRPRPLQRGQPTCPRRPTPPASPRARREGGLHPEAPVTVSPRGPGGGAQGRAGGGGDVGRARARGRGFHYETSDPVSVAALSASPRPALWAADSARRPLRGLPPLGPREGQRERDVPGTSPRMRGPGRILLKRQQEAHLRQPAALAADHRPVSAWAATFHALSTAWPVGPRGPSTFRPMVLPARLASAARPAPHSPHLVWDRSPGLAGPQVPAWLQRTVV